jgi:IS30 family transposase
MNSSRSLHRVQVDEALTKRDTTLEDFVSAGRTQGKNMEEIWMDLRQTTRVPFSVRTLYRWINDLEVTA